MRVAIEVILLGGAKIAVVAGSRGGLRAFNLSKDKDAEIYSPEQDESVTIKPNQFMGVSSSGSLYIKDVEPDEGETV